MSAKAAEVIPQSKPEFVNPDLEGCEEIPLSASLAALIGKRLLVNERGDLFVVEADNEQETVCHTRGKHNEPLVRAGRLCQFRMRDTDVYELEELADPRTLSTLSVVS